jgi:hypothetical protein
MFEAVAFVERLATIASGLVVVIEFGLRLRDRWTDKEQRKESAQDVPDR